MRRLNQKGCLREGHFGGWQWTRDGEVQSWIQIRVEANRLILEYRHRERGGEWESHQYPVSLEFTQCNLGGQRVWFRCPGRGCGRRVAILYAARYFVCRHCLGLRYECQREAPHFRALRRAQKLCYRLGGTGCIDDPVFRPKGMHRRTFQRLEWKFLNAADSANSLAFAYFGVRDLSARRVFTFLSELKYVIRTEQHGSREFVHPLAIRVTSRALAC